MNGTIEERFWAKVACNLETRCWEWQASMAPNGYGHFGANGYITGAHRWAYELSVGPIPDGLVLDHLCRNRRCVNPAHLEPVTQKVNTHRGGGNYSKTHCKRGHSLSDPTNLTPWGIRTGRRKCKACDNSYASRRRTVAVAA